MVDDDESIRLGDFGLSAVAEVESSYASSSGGAWGWMAPELIDPEEFGLSSSTPTRASDIYSFASVCIEVSTLQEGSKIFTEICFVLELYTGAAPFSGSSGQVVAKILKGLRPLRPQHEGIDMDECLWNLLNEC